MGRVAGLAESRHDPPEAMLPGATIDVVVVNWNAGEQLRACLRSLRASAATVYRLDRVVVVDNASTDGSLAGLAELDLPLLVIRNAENQGFAAACNAGARASAASYLLFLNPDTELDTDALDRAVAFMEAPDHQGTGICGIQLVDDAGRIWRSCARRPGAGHLLGTALGLDRIAPGRIRGVTMAEFDHRSSRRVDHVIGAFFLVRRNVFAALGGFDERFFLYFEDVDFSTRAAMAGHGSYFLASARAYHRGGGTSEQVKMRRLFHSLYSRNIYARKHLKPLAAHAVAVATLCLEPVVRLAYELLRGSLRGVADLAGAYRMLWRAFPALVREAAAPPPGPRRKAPSPR